MILTELSVGIDEMERRTGWSIKPEGACLGDVCVPLPAGARGSDDTLDAAALSERLRMPLLHDEQHGLWALGPATVSGRALTTAKAPDLTLPRFPGGEPFELASLLGTKVVMVAWASW